MRDSKYPHRSRPAVSATLLCAAILAGVAYGEDTAPSEKEVREAVVKSIDLLQRSAQGFTKHRECFSCHHQAMTMIAVASARQRGIKVEDDLIKSQHEHTLKFLRKNQKRFESGRGTGGQVDTAGYLLWMLEEAGQSPDEFTTAVTTYLLKKKQNLDHWKSTTKRPPSEASEFTTTYLAVRALSYFGRPDQQPEIEKRFEKAKQWLIKTEPKDTEDHVFRMQTLPYVKADQKHLDEAARRLLALQREDGGWAQKADMKSDAYATGSALVTLHQSGHLPTSDKSYRAGMKFLLKSQHEDGSWHVVSRSKPFQTYFETGFPHKKNQFISAAATGWATTALAFALPEVKD